MMKFPGFDLRGKKLAASVSGVYFLFLTLILCCPHPQGVADNSDMMRNFLFVSNGPVAMRTLMSKDKDGVRAWNLRYFNYYLRDWQRSSLKVTPAGECFEKDFKAGAISSCLPLYLPAWLAPLGCKPGVYDLNLNTFYLILFLSLAVFGTLSRLHRRGRLDLFIALCVLLLVLADAGSSRLLNSFYQDCGTYYYLVLTLCAGFLLWAEPRPAWLFLLLGASLLLMSAKVSNIPSTLVILVPFALMAVWMDRNFQRKILWSALFLATLGGGFVLSSYLTLRVNDPRAVCFNFIFNTALPHLAPEQRGEYLNRIGLEPELREFSGSRFNSYEIVQARRKSKEPIFDRILHIRSLQELIRDYPETFFGIYQDAIGMTGRYYQAIGSREKSYSETLQPPGVFSAWNRLRLNWLYGWPAYIFSMGIGIGLLGVACRRGWRDRMLLYAVMVNAVLAGSMLQVAFVSYGDWFGDLARHAYFANLLFDVQFGLAICACVQCLILWRRPATEVRQTPIS